MHTSENESLPHPSSGSPWDESSPLTVGPSGISAQPQTHTVACAWVHTHTHRHVPSQAGIPLLASQSRAYHTEAERMPESNGVQLSCLSPMSHPLSIADTQALPNLPNHNTWCT